MVCEGKHAESAAGQRRCAVFSEASKLSAALSFSRLWREERETRKNRLKIPRERIRQSTLRRGTPAQTIPDTIVKALDMYRKLPARKGTVKFTAKGWVRLCEGCSAGFAVPLSPPHPSFTSCTSRRKSETADSLYEGSTHLADLQAEMARLEPLSFRQVKP